MLITTFFPLISAIFMGGLGLFVFLKQKSRLGIIFSLFCLSVTIWLFGTFMMFISKTDEKAIFWDRIVYGGVIFIPILMYHLSLIFVKFEQKQTKILRLGYIISLIFFVLSRTNYFVNGLYKYSWGVHTQARMFHHIFLIFFFIYALLFFFNLSWYYKKTRGVEQAQVKYILFAFFVLNIGAIAYLPAYGIDFYPGIGFLAEIIGVVIIAYAIIKYRLMDIRIVMGRGTVYLFSFVAVIGLAFLLMFLNSRLIQLPTNIAVCLLLIIAIPFFHLIFRFFEKFASRYFYYTFYSYQKVLTDLGKNLTRILDLDKLSSLIANVLINTMKLDKTIVYLKNLETSNYQIKKNIGFKEKNGFFSVKDNFLIQYLEKTQSPLVYEEILLFLRDSQRIEEREKLEKIKNNMKRIEAALCLPLLIEDKVIGMIVLGNKISGDPYSYQDIELLTNLSSQASIALENARLYSRIKDLSQNLQQKVEEQTQKLKKSYEELKALDNAKSEFISITSHQLRTPLSVIKGYISMLLEDSYGQVPDEAKQTLKNMFYSNERLIKIVDDLLNISKIEMGKMELEKELTKIEDLIQSCCEEMKIEAAKKNLKFIFEKPKTPLPEIEIDSFKIRQVILNLIDNAIRYTQKGSVVLRAKYQNPNDKANGKIIIEIKDTGAGLNQEEETKIFESFTRGAAGFAHFVEGTGLGLYVAKKYLELHQGKIWAESSGKNKGSVFFIELPIQ